MIVADTNLIAYRLIEGEQTELALAVLARDPDWRVPPLWRHEFLSVLAVHASHGNITEGECLTLFERAVSLLQAGEHQPGLSEALVLALQARITPYDAQFVVLARQLGSRLITSDRELLRKFPGLACSPRGFIEGSGSPHETAAVYMPRRKNMSRLRESIAKAEAGKLKKRALIED